MRINVERLIGAVQESFDNTASYKLCFVNKKWYQMNEEEQKHANWCERNEHGSNNEVNDLCSILNIDCNNLCTIARLVRRWEQKHNWEKCFPVEEHRQKILDYLDKSGSFADPYIKYIHWNINNKAKKKSA